MTPATPFSVDVRCDRTASHVVVAGELDVTVAHELREALESCHDSARTVVDLRQLEFVDSTGLGLLVRAYEHSTGSARTFEFLGPLRPTVQRTFEIHALFEHLPFREA